MRPKLLQLGCALAAAILFQGIAQASIEFTGTGVGVQSNLSAKALFDITGTTWTITLSNVGGDVMAPGDVLTTLIFNTTSPVTLAKVSANIASGSAPAFLASGNTDFAGTNIGADWHFTTGISEGAVTADFGIGSVGLNIFSTNDLAEGFSANVENAVSGDPINGVDGGLLSATDNLASGNPQVTGSRPYVKSAAVFVFTANILDFDLTKITDVRFQYGTALSEPRIPGTPGDLTPVDDPPPGNGLGAAEAASVFVWLGLVGIFAVQARRRSSRA